MSASPTLQILRTRGRIANNYLAAIRNHVWVHLFVFLAVVLFLIMGGAVFFYALFRWLQNQEDFGVLLMNRLIGMVMMAFFSMLVFSNLVITLSTTYVSREIEGLMSLPAPHASVFFVKMAESVFYSSWAFAILSLPLFISFGQVREAPLYFYVLVVTLVVPFLLIPAGLGALATMGLCAFLPARRALKWTLFLLLAVVVGGLLFMRLTGASSALFSNDVQSFSQILNLLQVGRAVWSPHYWMTEGMLDLGRGNLGGWLYWFAMLLSTALMLMAVCAWAAPRLYYRGWLLARDTSFGEARGAYRPGRGFFARLERMLGFLGRTTRALVLKDLKTFFRDPAQWSQLVILFGLLFIYMANLRNVYEGNPVLAGLEAVWQLLLAFFNMAATCFMLSILATRFIYPTLSLEGKQFWIVGLAPINRERVVWQKYGLCLALSLVIPQALIFFSNWVLDVSPAMFVLSAATLALLAFGLTSLSVGLGAATPNFAEDNPARIANGVGGTLNVILSMMYIGVVVALELYPAWLYVVRGLTGTGQFRTALIVCVGGLVIVHAAAIVLPMRFGLRRWREMEF